MDCIFCQIACGEAPFHKVWESGTHLAFLSIFPNTEGVTVVIPKHHFGSDVMAMPEADMIELVRAAKTVALRLNEKLDDVGRSAIVCEGFGVDHAHIKLFPMHGTKLPDWKPIHSNVRTFFTTYPGYISTHDGERWDDKALAEVAKKIKK